MTFLGKLDPAEEKRRAREEFSTVISLCYALNKYVHVPPDTWHCLRCPWTFPGKRDAATVGVLFDHLTVTHRQTLRRALKLARRLQK